MIIKEKTIKVYVDSTGFEHITKESCLESEFIILLEESYFDEDANFTLISTASDLKRFIKDNPEFIQQLMED